MTISTEELIATVEALTVRIGEIESKLCPKIQSEKLDAVVAFNISKACAFELAMAASGLQITRSQLLRDIISNWLISSKKQQSITSNRNYVTPVAVQAIQSNNGQKQITTTTMEF